MTKHRDLFAIPFAKGFRVGKNLPVAFQGRKYPLILLSHGRSGNRFNLAWLAAALAAHGFIVGSMDHYFANSYHLSFEYVASKIWERPMDVSRHITHVLHHETWSRYIDGSKVGVAGNSQGGMTALWVGGARINAERFLRYQRGRRSDPVIPEYFKKKLPVDASPALHVHDKRVKAVFAMAPGVMKAFGFDRRGWIPIYLIVGEGDSLVPVKDNAGCRQVPTAES